MFSIKVRVVTAIIMTLSLAPMTWGQQSQPAPAAAPAAPDYVDFAGFKGKVFEVKHRDPRSLIGALRPLGSGFKGATISYSDEFKTLTVRDFPENIAAIDEALKRLDTPRQAQPDVELRMHVLIASNVEGAGSPVPAELSDVVRQLQSTLTYKSYYNITTIVQRVTDGAFNVNGRGVAELSGRILEAEKPVNLGYQYSFNMVSTSADPSGGLSVQLREAAFGFDGPPTLGDASIKTGLNVRGGEKVVVGTATLGNKAVILVLSARVIKS